MARTNRRLRGQDIEPGCTWYYKKFNGFADITSLFTTDIVIATGSIGKLQVFYCLSKFTPGDVAYDFNTMSGSFGFSNTGVSGANFVSKSTMNGTEVATLQMGPNIYGSDQSGNTWKATDSAGEIKLSASGTEPTVGDGVAEVWIAYKEMARPQYIPS
tara:strand:+ start:14435 stop:14908 length:474 start_codon:yes stop_codon:yes gene_type:complete